MRDGYRYPAGHSAQLGKELFYMSSRRCVDAEAGSYAAIVE